MKTRHIPSVRRSHGRTAMSGETVISPARKGDARILITILLNRECFPMIENCQSPLGPGITAWEKIVIMPVGADLPSAIRASERELRLRR